MSVAADGAVFEWDPKSFDSHVCAEMEEVRSFEEKVMAWGVAAVVLLAFSLFMAYTSWKEKRSGRLLLKRRLRDR